MTICRIAVLAAALVAFPCAARAQAQPPPEARPEAPSQPQPQPQPQPQAGDPIGRESRDAAAAFMGTLNFVVGRLGLECLAQLGRPETPKDFTLAWRQRNAEFHAAAATYMNRRLEAAQAAGGDSLRETVLREYVTKVRQNGEASVVEWFRTGDKKSSCRRAIAAVDGGALDVNAKAPIHAELQALVDWAAGR